MDKAEPNDNKLLTHDAPKSFKLSRKRRTLLGFVLLLAIFGIALAQGILAQCGGIIKQRMNIDDFTFGVFGMLYHVGAIVSTLVFLLLVKTPNRRPYIITTLLCCAFFLSWYHGIWNKYFIFVSNIMLGFFMTTMFVYIIVWNDNFSVFRFKTFTLAFVFVTRSLGGVVAFYLRLIYGAEEYGMMLFCTAFFLIFVAIAIWFFPPVYFHRNVLVFKAVNEDPDTPYQLKDYNEEFDKGDSVFKERKEEEVSIQDKSDFTIILGLFKNPVWHSNVYGNAILTCVIAALTSWVNEIYAPKGKENIDWEKLTLTAITSLAGPIGTLLLNFLLSLKFGSYYSNKVSQIMATFYTICFILGNIITHTSNQTLLKICIALFYMFGQCTLSYITGTNLSGGSQNGKPYGVAMAVLMGVMVGGVLGGNMFAYFVGKLKDRALALKYFMYFLGVGNLAALNACYFKMRIFKNQQIRPRNSEEMIEK